MKLALIADLHGNMTAVQALENELIAQDVQRIWCLGDLVGKGPNSDRTFDWAVANCELILRGNWDEGVGARTFRADGFYYAQLGPQRMDKLMQFPLEHHALISGRRLRLIHGRPVMHRLLPVQAPQEELAPLFDPDFDVVGYADTHRPGLRTLNRGLLFNTGSVGNGLGIPMVQFVILEGAEGATPAPFDLRFFTLPYDTEAAVRETEAQHGLPNGHLFVSELKTGIYARGSRSSALQRPEHLPGSPIRSVLDLQLP
ncbi:MAG: metallophosphoesterase family protein [Clostridiales bacterium]|nr:metallophosphoesterase family protein [Clostridiales bacterium]